MRTGVIWRGWTCEIASDWCFRLILGGNIVRKIHFINFDALFFKEISSEIFVLELRRVIFGGNFVRNGRFGDLMYNFWRKFRNFVRKAYFGDYYVGK